MPRTRASQPDASAFAAPIKTRKRPQRSISATDQEPVPKKIQRTTVLAEEQLTHELEDNVEDAENSALVQTTEPHDADVIHDGEEKEIDLRNRKVRFSDGDVDSGIPSPPDTRQSAELATSQTPDITRTSASPAAPPDVAPTHSTKHTRRSSMASVTSSIVHSSPMGIVEEVNYAPLQQVLDARARRRLRRSHLSETMNDMDEHERDDRRTRQELDATKAELEAKSRRMQELEWELESQRQLSIDVAGHGVEAQEETGVVKNLRQEIATLQKEIEETRVLSLEASPALSTHDDVDLDGVEPGTEDIVVNLVLPEEIGIASSPTLETRFVSHATIRSTPVTLPGVDLAGEASTQITTPDPTHELEIARFEQEITHLARQVADKESALRLLAIELQTLGFTSPTETPDIILPKIRAAFTQLRVELDQLLPQLNVGKYQNGELLHAIVGALRELLVQTAAQEISVTQFKEMEIIMRKQHNGLLDKLSEAEDRKKQLTQRWMELDKSGEQKSRRIDELQQLLHTAEERIDDRDETMAERDTTIAQLEKENGDLTGTIERLQAALTGYRNQIAELETLVTRMEAEHRVELDQMTETHRVAVDDLNDKLDTEILNIRTAETELAAKTATITSLEERIKYLEADLDGAKDQLASTQDELAHEHALREELEGDLEDRRAEIEGLSDRISTLETSLDALRGELQALRKVAESERHQREAAELEIDRLNGLIAELEQKIQDEGVTSNELRQKLFEVQQLREQQVLELTLQSEQREEQFQADMDEELERRKVAEQALAERNGQIVELEETLRKLNETMEELLRDKNEAIAQQQEQITSLTNDLYTSQQNFAEFTVQKTVEIESLNGNVMDLTQQLANAMAEVAALQEAARIAAEEHAAALIAHDFTIAGLRAENAAAGSKIVDLEAENSSLSRRVEEEATAMLHLENRFADEQAAHKSAMMQNAAAIAALEQTLEDTQMARDDGFALRDAEIEGLRALADARGREVAALAKTVVDMKARFAVQVDKDRQSITAMLDPLRVALAHAEDEARARDLAAEEEIKAMEALGLEMDLGNTPGAVVQIEGRVMNNGEVAIDEQILMKGGKGGQGKKVRRSRRRVYDSGIGVADEEVEMEEVV